MPSASRSEAWRSAAAGLLRRNRIYLFAGATPLLLGLGFILGALLTGTTELLIPVPHTLIFGTLGLAYAYRSNKDPIRLPGALEITGTEILQDGARIALREHLVDGVLAPEEGKMRVRVRRKGGGLPLLFEVRDREQGHEVLRALGFDVTQSVAELRGASDLFRWSFWKQLAYILLPLFFLFIPLITAGTAALGPHFAPFVGFMVLALLTYVFGLTFTPTRVRVGIDGVVARWMNKERFIPFSRVADVRKYTQRSGGKTYVGVELALDAGGVERIVCGQEGWMSTDVEEMLGRIREALELHRKSGGDVAPDLLARGSRDVRNWVTTLRAIGTGASAGLRTAPIPHDALIRIVEDAGKAPQLRVGAAVAALAAGPEAKERIRIAAGTTASPKLRVALETVAEQPEDEEAIAEAMSELETEEDPARAT